MSVAIQCPGAPGKRNRLARADDGCHEWTDGAADVLLFRDDAEANAYADGLPWLKGMLGSGLAVLTSQERP
jgi:hypothetical protein